ncbi:MAG: TonB-dependent receptor [Alphaproteobacteria bacterium]
MKLKKSMEIGAKFALLNAACLAGALAAPAFAQDAGAASSDTIVVTGYRASLASSTNAKRNATGFQDSVFAEDIGKFPDLNLAEALNRIPGVQLNRDYDGEGVQVQIRGLGPSFAKTLLNGNQIAVASDGGIDQGARNREVDLDMFPTELFSRLDVLKTSEASVLEGGVSGTVNMRQSRPFDFSGRHISYSFSEGYGESSREWSPRGAFIASDTWGSWGVLVGIAGADQHTRVDGWEAQGYGHSGNTFPGCTDCATDGTGQGPTYATVAAANLGHGFNTGDPINILTTSGLTAEQLSRALIPRLGRSVYTSGTRDRLSGVLSVEFRPSDEAHFYLDVLAGKAEREFDREDMDWVGRFSGSMVPFDLTVDSNNVVTSGTFANSQFFLEARPYDENVDFVNVNPGANLRPADWLKVDAQLNYSHSVFTRESPSFLFNTPLNTGLDVTYTNNGGGFPTISVNRDLADPNLGWTWNRVNVQNTKRTTETQGAHIDITLWPDSDINLVGGLAYDEADRVIAAFDNSTAYSNFVCGGGVVQASAAPCAGGAGSAVPTSAIAGFLFSGPGDHYLSLYDGNPGYPGFIGLNFGAIEAATNYGLYSRTAPYSTSGNTNVSSGEIDESTLSEYLELRGNTQAGGQSLRFNVGARRVDTNQAVTGPVTIAGVRVFQTLTTDYAKWLPSANVAYELTDYITLRGAASRTLTRQSPDAIKPGIAFGDVTASAATLGNPSLDPYFSDNYDFGGEWYTGGAGYVGVNFFYKKITGYAANLNTERPFAFLAQYGITYADLTTMQQQAIDMRGGPAAATVIVTQPTTISDPLKVEGYELNWVQPLDFLFHGLGFTANYTHIKLETGGNSILAAQAIGVAPDAYTITAYYEDHGLSAHVSYGWADQKITAPPPQNNVNVPLYSDARGQWDGSASYKLPWWGGNTELTLDAINITSEPLRGTWGYDNAAFTYYLPGYQVLLGVRGSF